MDIVWWVIRVFLVLLVWKYHGSTVKSYDTILFTADIVNMIIDDGTKMS